RWRKSATAPNPSSRKTRRFTGLRSDIMTVADATLEEIRALLAPTVADAAVFDGWSEAAVDSAATAAGVNAAVARLAFPNGAMDMIAAWIGSVDSAMEQAFSPEDLAALPVRE